MEWAGASQDTFKLLLAAYTNLGGDNPLGAVKTKWRGGEIKMVLKLRHIKVYQENDSIAHFLEVSEENTVKYFR